MNLESNEPGSGTLASKLGVDLDRAQYKNAGPESQSPTAGQTSPLTPKSGIGYDGCGFGAFNRQKSLQELLANAKGGPRCHNCGVKESPQWRKGPEEKPILCNACGTRYRRTNQFAPLSSHHPTSRKRPLQSVATRLLDNKVGNENKAPRIEQP